MHRLIEALKPDDVVIGGGNIKKLKTLPPGARAGDNGNAFAGGFYLWEGNANRKGTIAASPIRLPKSQEGVQATATAF